MDKDVSKPNPIGAHIACLVFAGLIVWFFHWACTEDPEFRRMLMRFVFSHPFAIGFVMLPLSIIYSVTFIFVRMENEDGSRDYTPNHIGILGTLISAGFVVYGFCKYGWPW